MNTFNTVIQVRFGHVDPAGIVYFPRIYDYIHDVFEEVWDKHVGKLYYEIIINEKIGFPLVHSEVDFLRPLRFGDRPVVSVSCRGVGRTSISLRYVFTVGGEKCLEARMTTVCVDLKQMKPLEVPEAFRVRFMLILEPGAEARTEGSAR